MNHACDAIADKIVERLGLIATDTLFEDQEWATSIPPTVLRLIQSARTIADFPTIVVTARSHRYNRAAQRGPRGLYEIETTFQIECYIEVMDDIDGELAKMLHDVHVALSSWTLEGTCRDSEIVAADSLLSQHGDPLAGLVVDFMVRYRTTDLDPGTLV